MSKCKCGHPKNEHSELGTHGCLVGRVGTGCKCMEFVIAVTGEQK